MHKIEDKHVIDHCETLEREGDVLKGRKMAREVLRRGGVRDGSGSGAIQRVRLYVTICAKNTTPPGGKTITSLFPSFIRYIFNNKLV